MTNCCRSPWSAWNRGVLRRRRPEKTTALALLAEVRSRLDDDLDSPAAMSAIDAAAAAGDGRGVAAAADLLGVVL